MANSKISALTSATTPLAGTETLPIVQSSTTKQVSVANLTAGRAVSVASLTASGVVSSQGLQAATAPSLSFGASKWMVQYEGGNTSRTYICGDNSSSYGVWEIYTATSTGSPTQALKVDASANTAFYTGNLIQGTAAKGINFTANTAAAGMTSQLLNWYEEGTWTPTDVSGAGLSLTLSGTAYYVRTGSLVHVWAFINYPATSNGNNAEIGGLPFTSKSGNNVSGTVFSNYATALSTYANGGTSAFTLRTPGNTVLTNANLSSLFVVVSISYRV